MYKNSNYQEKSLDPGKQVRKNNNMISPGYTEPVGIWEIN
jgi:hypothetical protein